MIPVTTFSGRQVALFGLGGSGLATARALIAGGAVVSMWDDHAPAREKAAAAGLSVVDLTKADWRAFSAFVLAPGVPLTHPEPHWTVAHAKAAGVEIIGDVELFARERRALRSQTPFIAITGTNGKSTTTALTAHLLRCFGLDAQMGGNIGTPVLALAPPSSGRAHVVECSSFQIDLAPSLDASVGVLLNLAPDHLDRHGDMEHYAAIKERLVAGAVHAVIGVDDAWCASIADRVAATGKLVARVSVARELDEGFFARGTTLLRAVAGKTETLADLAGIGSLRGAHNAQNALAAIAALGEIASDRVRLQEALRSFPGLAHRMEQVGSAGRVLFVNDSKATNADAAEKALAAFPGDIHWIVGGKAKEGGIAPLAPYFQRIARAYLIGASSADFAQTLKGKVETTACETLDVAVARAAEDAAKAAAGDARREPVVLLSPACASYDQFPNFEVRGDRFRELARAILTSGA